MKLTIEEHPETIKRYRHIKPAPSRKGGRCATRLSGTSRACTLSPGHSGPHVAHGAFNRVVAVWDAGATARKSEGDTHRVGSVVPRRPPREGGIVRAMKDFGRRVTRYTEHFMEEIFLLVFVLAMVGFVIDWALRIMGVR